MGFMRFNAMRRAVWVTFLYDVVTKMFGDPTNRNVWDQNLFNQEQNCRAGSRTEDGAGARCSGEPLKLKELRICVAEGESVWSNEDGIAPFAHAVRRKGAARAAAESRYVAIHVVGETVGGRSKLEWLRLILPELYAGSGG